MLAEIINEEDPEDFIRDVINQGCASGIVSSLIYYSQTQQFYDDHYNEIETLRQDLEDQWILKASIDWDLKNYYAWVAFEDTAYKLALELGLEI